MAERDYYEVLGVARDAPPDEVKRAYRRLAAKLHPDRNKEPDAAERFKELTEAYAVLSDADKRAVYDRYGHAGVHEEYGSGEDLFRGADFSGFGDLGFDLGSIFRNLFGGDLFGSGRPRGRDVAAEIAIEPADILTGRTVTVRYGHVRACPACRGRGAQGPDGFATCATCRGAGRVARVQRTPFGVFQQVAACGACKGAGRRIVKPCAECKGRAVQRVETDRQIDIPPGVEEGSRLRVRGAGDALPDGDPGDLILRIHAPLPPGMVRDGTGLVARAHIAPSVAVLGGEATVPTLDGPALVKVPPGIQPGDRLILRGEGVPPVGGGPRGPLVVEISVAVPTRLDAETRTAWERVAELEGREAAKSGVGRLLGKIGEWIKGDDGR